MVEISAPTLLLLGNWDLGWHCKYIGMVVGILHARLFNVGTHVATTPLVLVLLALLPIAADRRKRGRLLLLSAALLRLHAVQPPVDLDARTAAGPVVQLTIRDKCFNT